MEGVCSSLTHDLGLRRPTGLRRLLPGLGRTHRREQLLLGLCGVLDEHHHGAHEEGVQLAAARRDLVHALVIVGNAHGRDLAAEARLGEKVVIANAVDAPAHVVEVVFRGDALGLTTGGLEGTVVIVRLRDPVLGHSEAAARRVGEVLLNAGLSDPEVRARFRIRAQAAVRRQHAAITIDPVRDEGRIGVQGGGCSTYDNPAVVEPHTNQDG